MKSQQFESVPTPAPSATPLPPNNLVIEELRTTVRQYLSERFSRFLRLLPGTLSHSGHSVAERQMRHELATAIPVNAYYWLNTFLAEVDARLLGRHVVANAHDGLSSGTEETVALANLELRAEALHSRLIGELDAHLNRVGKALHAPLYGKALAPAGLYRALTDSAEAIEWPAAQRGLLFEKFDELVVTPLASLYRDLLEILQRPGLEEQLVAAAAAPAPQPMFAHQPAGAVIPSTVDKTPAAMPATAPMAPSVPSAHRPLTVDDKTRRMLQAHAQQASNDQYNDGSLAAELLALADRKPLPGTENDQTWAPLQRMSLAGQFLNEAVSDPVIPEPLRAQHEAMRFPLMKSALADQSFFTAVTHPLRSLVNELMLKSATSRITGSAETRRVAELLQQVLVQFDLAPDFVRQAMQTAQAIDETHVRTFFELQKQQAQQRREVVINEAKRLVIRELELHTFGRDIPESVVRFLNTAWGPLLAKRLLLNGVNHPQWKSAVGLMQQLLDHLDARPYGDPPSIAWPDLLGFLRQELMAAGSSDAQVRAAIAPLETAQRSSRK